MRAWVGKTLKFADDHQSMFDVVDQSGLQAVQTDETESAKDFLWGKQSRKLFLVSQAVLQGQQGSARADQCRQQPLKRRIGGGLQRDEDQFANPDLFGRVCAPG